MSTPAAAIWLSCELTTRGSSDEYGPRAGAVRVELEEWLAAKGMTSEDAIRIEGQREAADQVSMANAITSLRFCSTFDWSRFFARFILRASSGATVNRSTFLWAATGFL